MNTKVNHIAVLTSGGDSPGMNAAIRAVVRCCSFHKIECSGVYRGFEGLIENDFCPMSARSVRNIINRGGTILKSTRSEAFKTKKGREKAIANLNRRKIDGLIVIGGDGSFLGAQVLQEESGIPVLGLPGTIDNDIGGTDFTIGFDTALNTVVDAIDKIRDTASSHNRLFLVEVMGRDSGDIALNAGIGAGAEEILIPEENLGLERLLKSLEKSQKSGKTSSIVVVAEGDQTGKNTFELAGYIEENLKEYEVRVTVLGHIQRGGAPSCQDRVLASRLGIAAVEFLKNGENGKMMGSINGKIVASPFKNAILKKNKISKELLKVSDIASL